MDESFLFYDSLFRRVWIEGKKRLVLWVTGLHKYSCLFGVITIDDNQLFREYDKFNSDTILGYLRIIYSKFPKYYLFMDKASIAALQVKEGKRLFEQNMDDLIPL